MQMKKVLAVFAVVAFMAVPTLADWDESQPAKWVQLPNPTGWDVDITTDFVYDDWQCDGTGPITDVHFWGSWRNDLEGPISWIILEVWSDMPANHPDNHLGYSHPDVPLWSSGYIYPDKFTIRPAGTGDQGWLAPSFTQPQWNRPDHLNYYQVNIPQIANPFTQTEGEIYWLGIHVAPEQLGTEFGWKTSLDQWNDDATYYYTIEGIDPPYWNELIDPVEGVSLDMAFVLTVPEPASAMLVFVGIAGALMILRRRA